MEFEDNDGDNFAVGRGICANFVNLCLWSVRYCS